MELNLLPVLQNIYLYREFIILKDLYYSGFVGDIFYSGTLCADTVCKIANLEIDREHNLIFRCRTIPSIEGVDLISICPKALSRDTREYLKIK